MHAVALVEPQLAASTLYLILDNNNTYNKAMTNNVFYADYILEGNSMTQPYI